MSLKIVALGVRIDLDLTGCAGDEAQLVRDAWHDAAATESTPAEVTLRVREDAADTAHVLERLSQRVTLAAIEARRGRLWMLHAAGLAIADGRVVVAVGPSGRGKTTAARVLGRHSGYVSDETVAIDAQGRVHAYRKPLSIIESGSHPKVQRAPSALGLQPLPDAELRLAGIVLLDRRVDAPDDPVLEPVDLGDALDELVAQSSYLPSLSTPLQLMASLAASVGGVQRVVYREAESLVTIAPQFAEAAARPSWRPAATDPAGAGGYARAAVDDAIELDDPDRLVLLQGDTVRVIAGIAPALWRAASGVGHDDLVAAAVAAHGDRDDAGDVVDAAVAQLVEAAVLVGETWRRRDDVAWTGDGAHVVVLALDGAEAPAALEGSAAIIWHALVAGAGTSDQVAARVAQSAGVAVDAVREDVAEFLAELAARGLADSHRLDVGA